MDGDLEKRLFQMERKMNRLMRLAEDNAQAMTAVYKRSIALAQMVEALAEGREPRVTQSLRTEIDASLRPEEFVALAKEDPQEFVTRYGERLLDAVRRQGIRAVGTMGDLAPATRSRRKTLQ